VQALRTLVADRLREPNVRFWVATEGAMGAVSGIASGSAVVLSAGYGFSTF